MTQVYQEAGDPATKHIGSNFDLGSFGVTGVKCVIFTKNAFPHTLYIVCSLDLCILTSLRPSTVVIV